MEKGIDDLVTILEILAQEDDPEELAIAEKEIIALEHKLAGLEHQSLLSGPNDHRNAYITVHAGAGGTESCDWAEMLLRMYTRWAESRQFKLTAIDHQPGQEAGIKRATVLIAGSFAYGNLHAEIGVHRLVRISPFDSSKSRHTSFSSVDVIPEFEEEAPVSIDEKDLRVDTYRASGAGGQHVNKTDSAVRITHIPTGIVVQCQNERSQHKNRKSALKLLEAKLFRMQELERETEMAKLYGEKGEIAWGNQIRSYVMQPYTMVKDHRTGEETSNVDLVLNGDIDAFITSYLKHHLREKEQGHA